MAAPATSGSRLRSSAAARRAVAPAFELRTWRELAGQWRSFDVQELAGLAGSLAFVACGATLLVLRLGALVFGTPRFAPLIGVLLMASGVIGLLVPWGRLPVRAQLVFPVAGFVFASVLARDARTGMAVIASAIALLFVVAGFSQPAGTGLILAPGAFLALWVSMPGPYSLAVVVELVLEVSLAVAAGETVALIMRSRRRNEGRIHLLLDALRGLAHCNDELEGAREVARFAARLLASDLAAVYVADPARPGSFVRRHVVAHPTLHDLLPEVLNDEVGVTGGTRMARGEIVFMANPWMGSRAGRRIRTIGVLALRDAQGSVLGLILLGSPRAQWSISTAAEQAAEILSEQAVAMLARVKVTRALEQAAVTDPLTQIANRRAGDAALARLRAGDAVVMIDLDRFKAVNDRYGHAAGDATLRDLAQGLITVARRADTVSRFGGEEFLLILRDAGGEGALHLMMRLRRHWDLQDRLTTFSAGIAVHRVDESPDDTVARADGALYRAKAEGRNRDEYADEVLSLS